MLEVCVDSVDSALSALLGGADRLELCAALSEGGLTPTLGLLILIKKIVQRYHKVSTDASSEVPLSTNEASQKLSGDSMECLPCRYGRPPYVLANMLSRVAAADLSHAPVDLLSRAAANGCEDASVQARVALTSAVSESCHLSHQVLCCLGDRCRQGDFVYSSHEVEVMESDILNLKAHGADGFVFGCLDTSGNIQQEQCLRLLRAASQEQCLRLLRAASPMPCTFHRAFDCVTRPEEALATVMQLGFSRLLTSGQAPTAFEGAALIARFINTSAGRLTIMPGGGVTAHNVTSLCQLTGAREVHASARSPRRSAMMVPAGVKMGAASDERQWPQCDPDKVKAIRQAFILACDAAA